MCFDPPVCLRFEENNQEDFLSTAKLSLLQQGTEARIAAQGCEQKQGFRYIGTRFARHGVLQVFVADPYEENRPRKF